MSKKFVGLIKFFNVPIFVFDPKSSLYNKAVAVVPIVVAPFKVTVDPDIDAVKVNGEVVLELTVPYVFMNTLVPSWTKLNSCIE